MPGGDCLFCAVVAGSEPSHVVLDEPDAVARFAQDFEEQVEQLHADLLDRGEVPPGMARPFRPWREIIRAATSSRLEVRLDPDAESLPFEHAAKYAGRLDPFLSALVAAQRRTTVVVSQQASRLSELLQEQGVTAPPHELLPARPAGVELMHGLLREGWVSDALGLALFTDSEIFGWTKQRRSAPARRVVSERAAAARLGGRRGEKRKSHTGRGVGFRRCDLALGSGVALGDVDGDGLVETFGEIEAVAASCRFGDCRHASEPGCAVRAAIADGSLAADRLDAYRKLEKEARRAELATDAVARKAERRKWSAMIKGVERSMALKRGRDR